jgi:putative transposase
MARENRLWGSERLRGELLKLGVRVSKRTIQRHLRASRPPGDGQSWRTFLRNHTVWACDFLQVYDLWFMPIFAFFIVDVNTKRIVHMGVTRSPSPTWVAQQFRNVTPFGDGPQFIICDRDSKFGGDFDRAARGAGIRVIKCPVRSPLVNATCERFLGSVRRECLDHILILGTRHLHAVLGEYVAYFNAMRPHQGLELRIPVDAAPSEDTTTGTVSAIPILGGLHHDYRRTARRSATRWEADAAVRMGEVARTGGWIETTEMPVPYAIQFPEAKQANPAKLAQRIVDGGEDESLSTDAAVVELPDPPT